MLEQHDKRVNVWQNVCGKVYCSVVKKHIAEKLFKTPDSGAYRTRGEALSHKVAHVP